MGKGSLEGVVWVEGVVCEYLDMRDESSGYGGTRSLLKNLDLIESAGSDVWGKEEERRAL